jgi:bifunctional ADP-heptose synthase (sugar kinase/adenylyltransferase)
LDFASLCAEGRALNTRDKIVPVEGLAARVKVASAAGAKVVVASGGFDLLSREMIKQLESARAGNVVLIAAVDPDTGSDRLLPAEARSQLAAGVAAVDLVVIAHARDLRDVLQPADMLEVKSDLAPRLLARFRGPSRA